MDNRNRTVLLDSNIWRYIVDANAIEKIQNHSAVSALTILVAPSVVYEAARTKDQIIRSKLLRILTMPHWKRLMPEAYTECQEVLREGRRLSAPWIRSIPSSRKHFKAFEKDWQNKTGGFWDRARDNGDIESSHIRMMEGDLLERARNEASYRREVTKEFRWSEASPLDGIKAKPAFDMPGWSADFVAAWRLTQKISFENTLRMPGSAYRDWLHCFVHLEAMDQSSAAWNRFWLYEATPQGLSRSWLRWAFEHLQGFRKVTDGTPCDIQLATYFRDADFFVSADKNLIDILRVVREQVPFSISQGIKVVGGNGAIEDLIEIFSSMRNQAAR